MRSPVPEPTCSTWKCTLLPLLILIGTVQNLGAQGMTTLDSTAVREAARREYQSARQYRENYQFERADQSFRTAQQGYGRVGDWNMVVNCAIYRSQINYDLGQLDSLDHILSQAQAVAEREALQEEHFKQERLFYFRALYLEKTAQYQAASDMLARATAILAALDAPIALDSAYMSSHKALDGSISYERRDYEVAIHQYQAALDLFPASRPDPEKLLIIYNNMGLAFIEQGQVKKGIGYLDRSLKILPQLDKQTYYDGYLQTYFNLIRGYLLLHERAQAENYLQLARKILSQHGKDLHIWHSLSAQVQQSHGRLSGALVSYEKALAGRRQQRGERHPSVAKLYLAVAIIHQQEGRPEAALRATQAGIRIFDPTLPPDAFVAVPSLAGVNDYYLLIQLLHHRGTYLRQQYPDAPARILPTYRTAIQAIDSLRLLYESDASKLLLSKEAKAVFASALELLYQQYQQKADPAILEEAFRYMEKSKALLLLENIRKWRNIRLQQPEAVSDHFSELLGKERNAKLDLILIQRKIDELNTEASPAQREQLEQELRKLSATYEQIKTALADSFPQYYAASYGEKLADIRQVQRTLLNDEESNLLNYFIFEAQSFGMLIRRDTVIFHRLPPLAGWKADFDRYRSALSSPAGALMQTDQFQAYTRAAARLHQVLIRPFFAEEPADDLRLYLIRDDILGFLAYESLLISAPTTNTISYALEDQDYLIERMALAYGYSATLLIEGLEQAEKGGKKKTYGGFAPVFADSTGGRAISRDCTTGSLMYLPYSARSVQETHSFMGGEIFLHETASLENFKRAAGQFRVLQLSTHACVDEQDAMFNVIYFHDTTLATYQIFDIPISADLIILSACETGNGNLLQGEGIMSLSRAFYYAGSANIVTSLWPADDHATQQLMVLFNRHLNEGLPKDIALRRAKLEYLQSPALRPMHAAPAFWANFILIGNQQPVETTGFPWEQWQWLLLPFLGLALLLAFYSSGRRRQ